MFTKKIKNVTDEALDTAINNLLSEMAGFDGYTDEYAKMADQLDKLYKVKAMNKADRVSADTLALISGNLAGILLIVGYERANVVTSKALGFVRALR